MKTAALTRLRRRMASGEPALGLWITLESPSLTEIAVGMGLDWVVIDTEHGHLDHKEVLEHLRATVRSNTVALVRITELNGGLIKRVLDMGADGFLIPWMETANQVREAVEYAHYPPRGRRGLGAERATCWGQALVQHVAEAEENVLVIPIIESVTGGRNIHELAQVPGVDCFFIGPADYSSTAGYPGQWQGPGVAEQLLAVRATIAAHGKHCGVLTTGPEDLLQRREQGFSMLGVGIDAGLFSRGLRQILSAAGRESALNTALQPFDPIVLPQTTISVTPSTDSCATTPPDETCRPEVMARSADAARAELTAGVQLRTLVGAGNGARDLTTGLVRFEARAVLPYHQHPHAEVVTVWTGEVLIEVAGRRYSLHPLDCIMIPPHTPHRVSNPTTNPTLLHFALPTENPARAEVDFQGETRDMPPDTLGIRDGERIHRANSPFHEMAPNVACQNFYHRDLGCPWLSGGYARFAPGARLPCHFHDFDESICIIEGTATCIVEEKRYFLSDGDTALVPQGRAHYFVNEGTVPMAMLWVYAGPMPTRTILPENYCIPELPTH